MPPKADQTETFQEPVPVKPTQLSRWKTVGIVMGPILGWAAGCLVLNSSLCRATNAESWLCQVFCLGIAWLYLSLFVKSPFKTASCCGLEILLRRACSLSALMVVLWFLDSGGVPTFTAHKVFLNLNGLTWLAAFAVFQIGIPVGFMFWLREINETTLKTGLTGEVSQTSPQELNHAEGPGLHLRDGKNVEELLEAAMPKFVALYQSGRLPPNLPIVIRLQKPSPTTN